MTVNTKHMVGVRVETRAGTMIGRVASFNLNQTTGQLVTIEVRPHGLVAGLTADTLLVPWDAVLEITEERILMIDGVVSQVSERAVIRSNPISSSTV